MKKLYLLWFLVGLLLFSSLASAQDSDTELSETYESTRFSVSYPEDWETSLENSIGIVLNAPIAGADIVIGDFIGQSEDIEIWLILAGNKGNSALEYTLEYAEESSDGLGYIGLSLEFLINGREAAFVDLKYVAPKRFFTMILDEGTILMGWVDGFPSQFAAVMPTLNAVLNTFRLADDDSEIEELHVEYILPETYIREGEWSFDYPTGWEIEESDDTAIMVVPGIETLQALSVFCCLFYWDLSDEADMMRDDFLGKTPEMDYERYEFERETYSGIWLDFTDPEKGIGYTSIIALTDEGIHLVVIIIGTTDDIVMLAPVVENIIATVKIDS